MLEWSKLLLGKQAKELGFVRDTYEKVCRLTEILKFFENDAMLGYSLALKGGTAINLTIFNLPRLSVDIDLDFSENVSRDEMMATRSIINDRIEKFMKANGYLLSPKSKHYHALDSFVYEYSNSGGMKDNIKVEINYMLRCHVLKIEQRHFESSKKNARPFLQASADVPSERRGPDCKKASLVLPIVLNLKFLLRKFRQAGIFPIPTQ